MRYSPTSTHCHDELRSRFEVLQFVDCFLPSHRIAGRDADLGNRKRLFRTACACACSCRDGGDGSKGTGGRTCLCRAVAEAILLAFLLPVVWMALQIFPAPTFSLANPIWSATSIALNQPSLSGRISVDPGATLRSLFLYLIDVSLLVSTVIITKDRQRAETILSVLCVVTTLISAEVLLSRLDLFAGVISDIGAAASPFPATAALAILANGALVARALERHLHQQDIRNLASVRLWVGVLSGLFGIAVSVAALATSNEALCWQSLAWD